MLIGEYLNPNIPPLKSSDSVDMALNWLNEFKIVSMPVVEQGSYLGMISEVMLLDTYDSNITLGSFQLENSRVFLSPLAHFSEVLKMASRFDLDTLAVLDEQNNYMGLVCVRDLVGLFAKSLSVQSEGGLLVISMYQRDFSLSQIARIIEAENAKVLSSFVEVDEKDPLKLLLTLKIDKKDLSFITATLHRFDYQIVARFDDTRFEATHADRLDILFRLFDIK
jgi:CBS domain-containing protein